MTNQQQTIADAKKNVEQEPHVPSALDTSIVLGFMMREVVRATELRKIAEFDTVDARTECKRLGNVDRELSSTRAVLESVRSQRNEAVAAADRRENELREVLKGMIGAADALLVLAHGRFPGKSVMDQTVRRLSAAKNRAEALLRRPEHSEVPF